MKLVQTHVKYGVVTGLAMIIVGLLLYVTNLMFESSWASWIGYLVFLIGLILNANAFSKANDANITFGNAFGSCFKTTAIIAVMYAVWTIIFILIFPEMMTKGLDMASARMEKQGMSEEQIEQGLAMSKKFMNMPMMTIFALAGTLFMGTIFSLIAAAIAKKNPQPQQIQ